MDWIGMAAGGQLFEDRLYVGGRALQLLSDALNVSILRLLAGGPLAMPELSDRLVSASRTTRFNRLRDLEELGVIAREKQGGAPPLTLCMLSPAGLALLPLAKRFASWLNRRPEDAGGQDKTADILAIGALSSGWSTTALRWLAESPQTVTELAARCSPEVSYHDARRVRLALAEAGLAEAVPIRGRGQPYALTPWARRSAGPLAASVRWERDFLFDAAPAMRVEGETLLLLAASLVDALPGRTGGVCTLQIDGAEGIRVEVEEGRVSSLARSSGTTWGSCVRGTTSAWLEALLEGRCEGLEMRGSIRLTTELTAGVYDACSRT